MAKPKSKQTKRKEFEVVEIESDAWEQHKYAVGASVKGANA